MNCCSRTLSVRRFLTEHQGLLQSRSSRQINEGTAMEQTIWPLHEAKNRFSELIDRARDNGPQEVSRRGVKAAIVMSFEDYSKLKQQKEDLVTFFQKSPLKEITFERQQDLPREVNL